MSEKKTLRCAVYTRKSSEEGLDQDFNSLEAQREACEAYVRSQAHEGWKLLDDHFDDGGFSGGNIQRPGLESLMKSVREGRVDVIIIYKIDRLTRSLTDFAKLAETFDKHGVSFVSVTQQFNTTTSMGRLMLNVLLSFAQFEREITGERIRDKIAASKRKGMWMGGNPPMAYDVVDRRLVINGDAEAVRTIFKLYLEEGTVPALLDRLAKDEIKTTRRIAAKGRETGGKPFTRGHVYKLLTNPIYIGRVSHKGTVHPGQHEAIVDLATWSAVQAKLTDNTQGARTRRRRAVQKEYLLAGLLHSERGNSFIPMHATKRSRRYRYYVEDVASAKSGKASRRDPVRLPSAEIEAATVQTMVGLFRDGGEVLRQLPDLSSDQARRAVKAAAEMSARLTSRFETVATLVHSLVRRVTFRGQTLVVVLNGAALRGTLVPTDASAGNGDRSNHRDSDEPDVTLSAPIDVKRRGGQMKLVVDGERTDRAIDLSLVTAIARGHCWARMLTSGEARSLEEIAEREGVGRTYVAQLLPLGFLRPSLVEQVLAGRQSTDLSAARLIWKAALPLWW